jgi:hypothetical protein
MKDVPLEWAAYVDRWYATSTLQPSVRGSVRANLARWAGGWPRKHPEITDPGQWTRQTCAAWIAAVERMQVGDYVQRRVYAQTAGDPLGPATKAGLIYSANTLP